MFINRYIRIILGSFQEAPTFPLISLRSDEFICKGYLFQDMSKERTCYTPTLMTWMSRQIMQIVGIFFVSFSKNPFHNFCLNFPKLSKSLPLACYSIKKVRYPPIYPSIAIIQVSH